MNPNDETYADRLEVKVGQLEAELSSERKAYADALEILKATTEDRNQLKTDVARLQAGGCARDQKTTQWCAEAVELRKKLDEALGLLTDAAQRFRHYEQMHLAKHTDEGNWKAAANAEVARGYERFIATMKAKGVV